MVTEERAERESVSVGRFLVNRSGFYRWGVSISHRGWFRLMQVQSTMEQSRKECVGEDRHWEQFTVAVDDSAGFSLWRWVQNRASDPGGFVSDKHNGNREQRCKGPPKLGCCLEGEDGS